jgi:CheY-specific phosphatase CheX
MNPSNPPANVAAPELRTILTNVLGDLAFMITDDEEIEAVPGTIWMCGEVSYLGPTSGTVRCWCTRTLATQLAANLLGIEPEVGEAQIAAEDALCEFLNVLCGQLVTAWHGTESVFNLTIPNVTECIDPPKLAAGGTGACQIAIDGEPLYCTHESGV